MAEWAFLNPSPPDLPPPLLLRPQGLRAPPAGRPVAQDRLSHGPAHGWGSARTERAAGVAPVAPPRHPRRGCQRANNGVDPKGATDRLRCPGMTPTHASPPSSAPAPRPPPARRIAYPTTGACSRRTRQGTHEPQGAASLNLLRSRQTPARQRRARRGRHRCHAPQRPQRALRCRAEGAVRVRRYRPAALQGRNVACVAHACHLWAIPPCAPQYCLFSMSRFYLMGSINGLICMLCRFDGGCQSLRLPRCWILVPGQAQRFGSIWIAMPSY